MNENNVRQIVKEETAHLATKKETREGFDELTNKIDGVESKLTQKINSVESSLTKKIDGVERSLNFKIDGLKADNVELKESVEVLAVKMDALMGMTEHFINKTETEEQERKFGQKQLERRVEKLEEKV